MSALGQKRSFGLDQPNVRYAPKADLAAWRKYPRLNFGRPLEKKPAHSDQAEHPSNSSA
jgi:hypothetical protein